MQFHPEFLQSLIFGGGRGRRFTQDSPILPDVWQQFCAAPKAPADLLLTPHIRAAAGQISRQLITELTEDRGQQKASDNSTGDDLDGDLDVVYNRFTIAARLRLDELIRVVLPRTTWFRLQVWPKRAKLFRLLQQRHRRTLVKALVAFRQGETIAEGMELTFEHLWLIYLTGALLWAQQQPDEALQSPELTITDANGEVWLAPPDEEAIVEAIVAPVRSWKRVDESQLEDEYSIWQIHRNRPATTTINHSTLTVKADAARQLFGICCKDITWAVIDSGIDARHSAFREPAASDPAASDPAASDPAASDPAVNDATPAEPTSVAVSQHQWIKTSRVDRTYDFTRVRLLLNPANLRPDNPQLPESLRKVLANSARLREELEDLRRHLLKGRQIDWTLLEPFLRIQHDKRYTPPENEHGTHVAGILAAHDAEEGRHGVCPDIRLLDLRVLGNDGAGDEFSVLSALQFVGHLNAHKDYLMVHGANLSLSIHHKVESYACGATPVCEEAERLMASGVVVVAAAGNQGYLEFQTSEGVREGYNPLSVTDPGNAEKLITVGSTHRISPHTYGVSYFSSRGPTGDGRAKPDLVAPGEKIEAPVPGEDWKRKDGTSMAAPHVSGAAALLMARHTELKGKSERIKKVLCSTATDLGRERYFQGFGMVDILRALQSV